MPRQADGEGNIILETFQQNSVDSVSKTKPEVTGFGTFGMFSFDGLNVSVTVLMHSPSLLNLFRWLRWMHGLPGEP
jgi:hypothetical protein